MSYISAVRDKVALREAAPSILLVVNTFVWYITTYAIFNTIINGLYVIETEKLGLFAIYFSSIAITAIPGSKYFVRARTKSLGAWLFMGALATLLLTTFSGDGILTDAFLALFFGASIGIGLPSCLSYFADSTSVEKRGFVGGVIWSTVGITVLLFAFLISNLGLWEAIILLTIWRFLGGICFSVLNRSRTKPATQKAPGYLELLRKKEILLYLFPWVMFSIINFAEAPLLERVFGAENFAFMQFVEFALVGIFATLGGVVADFVGRKRVVIAGFVMLGIEYAALSAFSTSQAAFYLFLILDGITWGLLFSVLFMAIWGDLAENREKEKYYTLGGLPFILAAFLSVLIKTYARDIPATTAFSFASFFLFLAVLPLMYAPETLPEKTMKSRELKNYTEKALQRAKKEAEKNQKKRSDGAEKETDKGKEEAEESLEEEEARKLAEKYY